MISHFFIDRPIFASVLSIVFVLAGGVAVFTLPVAQYPEVTPPTVLVTALYPGANAQTVRDTVAAPIEEQVSGVEGMMYMSSQSTNDGTYRLRSPSSWAWTPTWPRCWCRTACRWPCR